MDSTKLGGPATESPRSHSPALASYVMTTDGNVDYIISDYMERLGTRLNILETELKYAWRALDLLSQEYIKMWQRLEKLEGLLCEQQTVISQLIEFYTSGGSQDRVNTVEETLVDQQRSESELDAIEKSLGASIGIEETSVLREKLAQQELARMRGLAQDNAVAAVVNDIQRNVRNLEALETLEEEGNMPDEAFYRSLNNAYREDLICGDVSRPTSQLGMIWEEAEEVEDSNGKKETESTFEKTSVQENIVSEEPKQSKEEIQQMTVKKEDELEEEEEEGEEEETEEDGEIFSAADYKSYRGNAPCVSEQDLAQVSRLSALDKVALEKLQELDRLETKLQKDSQNIIELQSMLRDSPKRQYATENEAKLAEEASSIEEQIRKIYAEPDVDSWMYSKSPGSTGRSISRVSTDSGLTTDGDFTTRSLSPRLTCTSRSNMDSISSNYTPPRLGYSSTLLEKSPEPVIQLAIDVGSYAKGYAENKELTDLMVESFATVTCASPTIYNTTTDKVASPTPSAGSLHSLHSTQSIHSVRTRQDGYFGSAARLNLDFPESRTPPSPSPSSPPPPAPHDPTDNFLISSGDQKDIDIKRAQSPSFLSKADKLVLEQGRLSPRAPHSPKSPRVSPKHLSKPTCNNNIVAAKSDSGLSSMSGWSSLDKSPSSPKSSIAKMLTSYSLDHPRSQLAQTSQSIRTASPIATIQEAKSSVITQEPLYDTPEGRDAFANSALSNTSQYNAVVNHISSLSSVKSPVIQDDYNFVPPPAPGVSTTCQSPKKRGRQLSFDDLAVESTVDFLYRSEQPAIYSVAGGNRTQAMANVYTSSSGTYGPRTTSTGYYPDSMDQFVNYDGYSASQYGDTTLTSGMTGKKPMRALSYGDSISNHEGYKAAMYRNMFPTGNILDALSYYPTSANLPRTETESSWLNSIEGHIPHDSTSSSIRSMTSEGSYSQSQYGDRRYTQPPTYQSHQYHHTYLNQNYAHAYQQQYQQYQMNQRQAAAENAQLAEGLQRQWQREHQYTQENETGKSTIDPSQQQGEFYDASSVIVSQSGYISISADIKDHELENNKNAKKIRRGSSLKNAMSSMSNWLPDLHLPRRHRSQSLPGGVRREDIDGTQQDALTQQRVEMMTNRGRGRHQGARKKKKNLVSTVSGILQKAKRRNNQSSQSLSDPEQSETEWSSGRQSGLSEDEDSVMSDVNQDPPFFAKVKSSSMKKKPSQQQIIGQQQQQQILAHQQTQQLIHQQAPLTPQQREYLLQEQQRLQEQQQALQQQIQQHQEQLQKKVAEENWLKEKENEQRKSELSETELSDQVCGVEEEASGKSTGSGSGGSTIFPTVGDIKKSTGSSDEAPNEKAPKLPPLMGGASMEFAVSRALGKYRQRQSSTVSDEQGINDDGSIDKKSDEGNQLSIDGGFEYQEDVSEKSEKSSGTKGPELVTSISEEAPPSEGSPSASSTRGYAPISCNRFLPRHQQSLEIPWGGSRSGDGDEDNRSTHSHRSTSRVSSRRQSTEDSIDSEDEWYCYELRKLEELERQTQVEIEMGETLVEVPEENEPFQPGEEVKERMSFVLRELKLKAKPKDEEEEKRDLMKEETHIKMNGTVVGRDRRLENGERYRDGKPFPKKKPIESVESVFARVTDYHTWAHEEAAKKEKKAIPMEEGSSGETSGPDSPVHSMDEEEDELHKDLDEHQSRRSSSGSTLRHSEKHLQGSDSLSREGSVSVPPSEVSVSIPGGWDSESTVLEGDRDGAGSAETGTTATLSLPKIKIDSSSCGSSDTTLKEGQISPGPPGSKWKLLKALKERKAEEKLKEVEDASKEAAALAQGPTSVSIMIK